MQNYIKNIRVNKVFHLQGFDIPIMSEGAPHLFITGKNGSGKTVLLNAIADFIDKVGKTSSSKVDVDFLYEKDMILAFYAANRKVRMDQSRTPEKPSLTVKENSVKKSLTKEFLKFLVDLKVQAALAKNENYTEDADKINSWFGDFEKLLGGIYEDDGLRLDFNFKDYSFHICTDGQRFKFNQLSDGYAAIIDIVADLILKMQKNGKSVTRAYEKKGVVMIDEIETHLHLELQKNIMPILTKVFPNIQFIVTTHSPFVLSSLPNAVAFDLEKRQIIDELNEYSYEALAEGYFGVRTSSSYLEMRLEEFKVLLAKPELSGADKFELRRLLDDLGNVSEAVSPLVVGQFNELRLEYARVIKGL